VAPTRSVLLSRSVDRADGAELHLSVRDASSIVWQADKVKVIESQRVRYCATRYFNTNFPFGQGVANLSIASLSDNQRRGVEFKCSAEVTFHHPDGHAELQSRDLQVAEEPT
jgi:hypothetical protein